MRKLIIITVLLSFFGYMGMVGQNVPVLVAGKVHISGPMYSLGAVHVDTITVDSAMIDIDNGINGATAILMTDSIIFYSNDTFEGLLRNQNSNGGGVGGINDPVHPTKVIVRKTFEANKYTYLSLPFTPTAVLKAGTDTPMPFGPTNDIDGAYWGWRFDQLERSISGPTPAVWKEMTTADKFDAGKGFTMMVWFNTKADPTKIGTKWTVDFVSNDANSVKNVFAFAPKSIDYTMYRSRQVSSDDPIQTSFDAGWEFIGGLNSTVFSLAQKNIGGYDFGKIYYQKKKTAQSPLTETRSTYDVFVLGTDDAELEPGVPAPIFSVGPYSPFYIQGQITALGSAPGQFTYKAIADTSLLLQDMSFRSSKNEGPQDRLYFALTSDKDRSFDRFILSFGGNNSESYIAIEDAIKMATVFDDKPGVWSLFTGTNKALVENGLPMKDNREIKMGFSAHEEGSYTISLKLLKNQDVRNVVLVDNVTGAKVDLLQDTYSFNTGAVDENNDRFILYINSSYTGTPAIDAQAPYAYTKDNILTVKNLTNGDRVQVLDLSGRTIAFGTVSGKEYSTVLSQRGVYVVNVKGAKTSVLKILNK